MNHQRILDMVDEIMFTRDYVAQQAAYVGLRKAILADRDNIAQLADIGHEPPLPVLKPLKPKAKKKKRRPHGSHGDIFKQAMATTCPACGAAPETPCVSTRSNHQRKAGEVLNYMHHQRTGGHRSVKQ